MYTVSEITNQDIIYLSIIAYTQRYKGNVNLTLFFFFRLVDILIYFKIVLVFIFFKKMYMYFY